MILIVAGVAGSGKTTVGQLIASRLGWEFADGDDFHSPANVAKMRSGQPLSDAERLPWLADIGVWMDAEIAAAKSAVVACSGLARRYREALLAGRPLAQIAFLEVSREEAVRRLHDRHGHFFGEQMVNSQFAELEEPQPGEERTHPIPSDRPPDQLADHVIALLGLH
jgi:carbohydrate kinase (thermoresistant glucokinase family)